MTSLDKKSGGGPAHGGTGIISDSCIRSLKALGGCLLTGHVALAPPCHLLLLHLAGVLVPGGPVTTLISLALASSWLWPGSPCLSRLCFAVPAVRTRLGHCLAVPASEEYRERERVPGFEKEFASESSYACLPMGCLCLCVCVCVCVCVCQSLLVSSQVFMSHGKCFWLRYFSQNKAQPGSATHLLRKHRR